MGRRRLFVSVIAICFSLAGDVKALQTGSTLPVKYLGSCQVDLTGDQLVDVVMLFETDKELELVALVQTNAEAYTAFVLNRPRSPGILTCELGKTVKETTAGNRKGGEFATPGAFVLLTWPETSSVAYIWQKDHFVEVFTSD